MADWTDIPDENLSPNAPARSADMLAMRDNITAQAEGATGAPKTQTAAIEDDAVTADKLAETTAERDWVARRMAANGTGAVGTYALLRNDLGSSGGAGGTVSGSNLSYSNSGGGSSGGPGGTWRRMGYTSDDSVQTRTTLYLRIS